MLPPPSSSPSASLFATCVIIGLALCNIPANAQETAGQLRLLAEWKEIEYEFPSAEVRQLALDRQEYVPGNGVSIDMDIDYGGSLSNARVFYLYWRTNETKQKNNT